MPDFNLPRGSNFTSSSSVMRTVAKQIAVHFAAVLLFVGPATVHAQNSARIPRTGYVGLANNSSFDAFRQGLRDLGYVEGTNVVVETRFATGTLERLPEAKGARLLFLPFSIQPYTNFQESLSESSLELAESVPGASQRAGPICQTRVRK